VVVVRDGGDDHAWWWCVTAATTCARAEVGRRRAGSRQMCHTLLLRPPAPSAWELGEAGQEKGVSQW
jgi:hypothetical protein